MDGTRERRRGRLLLAARALSCGTLILACKSPEATPPPGNPKGSWYDNSGAGARGGAPSVEPPGSASAEAPDAGPPLKTPQPQPSVAPLPANPKGSWYDEGGYQREGEPKKEPEEKA